MKIRFFILFEIGLNFLFVFSSWSQVSITPFATGFYGITDIQSAGDDRLFIIEQLGRVKIVDRHGNVNPVPFLDIHLEVAAGGEQGLLGLAFSPNYKNDSCFYVNYTTYGMQSRISRFHVSSTNPDSALASSEELLIVVNQPFVNHNGGCLQFGNDGYLYCALGDGGNGGDPLGYGQNLKDTLGNLLRIDVSPANGYNIPPSNPFINDTAANPLIWAYGLRNPWRFSFDRITHDLWIGDVGQGLWEEIDFQPAKSTGGENYGWRCYEGNHPYNTSGCGGQSNYVMPVYDYAHSPTNGCSVTGGYVYRGGKYAAMFGKYFFADYCQGVLHTLKKDTGFAWTNTIEGDFNDYDFGTFGEDRYGELYLGGFTSGTVYKIIHTDCTPTASIYDKDTMFVCSNSVVLSTPLYDSLSFEWYFNGALVDGADTNFLLTNQSGRYRVRVTTGDGLCTNLSSEVYVYFSLDFTGLPSFICDQYNTVALTGIPAGGTFSGDGIFGNTFYPQTVSEGSHVITYSFNEDYGCPLQKQQSITVTHCGEENSQVIIAPNPTSGSLIAVFSSYESGFAEILIYNALGKLCHEEKLPVTFGTIHHAFQLQNLSSGVYTFQLKSGDADFRQKFIIEKAK
ncbi:MAG: PQQ-dependent sugar dehydrogenase [Bacteroidia bacterium]